MPSTHTHLAHVITANRPASTGSSQDRIIIRPHAVAVLDGASTPDPTPRDGGWYADTLAHTLTTQLDNNPRDLADLLAAAITHMREQYDLTPGTSPSSTISIVRWDEHTTEALVLGDSPVIAFTATHTEVCQR